MKVYKNLNENKINQNKAFYSFDYVTSFIQQNLQLHIDFKLNKLNLYEFIPYIGIKTHKSNISLLSYIKKYYFGGLGKIYIYKRREVEYIEYKCLRQKYYFFKKINKKQYDAYRTAFKLGNLSFSDIRYDCKITFISKKFFNIIKENYVITNISEEENCISKGEKLKILNLLPKFSIKTDQFYISWNDPYILNLLSNDFWIYGNKYFKFFFPNRVYDLSSILLSLQSLGVFKGDLDYIIPEFNCYMYHASEAHVKYGFWRISEEIEDILKGNVKCEKLSSNMSVIKVNEHNKCFIDVYTDYFKGKFYVRKRERQKRRKERKKKNIIKSFKNLSSLEVYIEK